MEHYKEVKYTVDNKTLIVKETQRFYMGLYNTLKPPVTKNF